MPKAHENTRKLTVAAEELKALSDAMHELSIRALAAHKAMIACGVAEITVDGKRQAEAMIGGAGRYISNCQDAILQVQLRVGRTPLTPHSTPAHTDFPVI